jgi:hypothetical protein
MNHNRAVIRQPGSTAAMVVSADRSGRYNECGASVGQTDLAHTPVLSPICKDAPTPVVAPFGQQDGIRFQAFEVTAQAGSAGSTPASDVQRDNASRGIAFSALVVMGLEPDWRGRI